MPICSVPPSGTRRALLWRVQPGAGAQEELVHPDVGRQPALAQHRHVMQRRHIAEQPRSRRPQEAALQFVVHGRLLERERGQDLELDRGVGAGLVEQRVGDRDRLAERERQQQDDLAAGPLDDGVGERARVVKAVLAVAIGSLSLRRDRSAMPTTLDRAGSARQRSASAFIRPTSASAPRVRA